MKEPSKTVLITGCSSGIGKATALLLLQTGMKVYATARKVETLDELKKAGCKTLSLDVNSESSMLSAISEIEANGDTIGVLINNAGYGLSGAVESISIDSARKQFETNFFGLMRLTQLVLPNMRKQKWGKIVNISSMGANFTFPGGGLYHATKYALEALSDALRFEVKNFGVDVIIIQPGLIKTGFVEAVAVAMEKSEPGPYQKFNDEVKQATLGIFDQNPLGKLGGKPEDVANIIKKAITIKKPKARYKVTLSAHLLIAQKKLMPDWAWDAFLAANFPQPS